MFASPVFLFLLVLPALYLLFRFGIIGKSGRSSLQSTLYFSSIRLLPDRHRGLARFFHPAADILASAALVFFILALSRPLGGRSVSSEKYFGLDMILAIDVSGSMLNVDSIPSGLPYRDMLGRRVYYDAARTLVVRNRMNSARNVIREYVKKQEFNRIGIVIFAGYSYTRCPLTLDKNMLVRILDSVGFDPANDGTAIGMGIATSVNRLKRSEAKSRVIILLTDGNNNSGMIDPLSAAKIAGELGIRVYTIGLGNPEGFLQPASMDFQEYVFQTGEGLDEKTLQGIADSTRSKFYRAYDPDSLQKIYNDIDQLEKSRIEIKRRVLYKENFMPFLLSGLILLAGYIALTALVTKIP